MAYTMQALMTGAMNNPDVLIMGIAAGFIIAKFMNQRNRNSGFGGGGGMF